MAVVLAASVVKWKVPCVEKPDEIHPQKTVRAVPPLPMARALVEQEPDRTSMHDVKYKCTTVPYPKREVTTL